MGVESAIGEIGTSYVYDLFPAAGDVAYSGVKGVAIQGAAGNLSVIRNDGVAEIIPVLSGQILPIGFSKIVNATTTATSILVMR